MKKTVAAVFTVLLCEVFLGCAISSIDNTRLAPEQIADLRKEYPTYAGEYALAISSEITFENTMSMVDCIAIIEVVGRNEDSFHDVMTPGGAFSAAIEEWIKRRKRRFARIMAHTHILR